MSSANCINVAKRELGQVTLAAAVSIAAALGMPAIEAQAQQTTVRGDFSGNWANPEQPGHGVQVSVVDERRAGVIWFTYDPMGNPIWLLGVGEISGDRIEAEVALHEGAMFPPAFASEDVLKTDWGTLTLTFDDCNSGELSWEPTLPGFMAGSMPLERVTGNPDLRCGEFEQFEKTASFSLDAGPSRWQAAFADFSEAQQDLLETEAEWGTLPEPMADRRGFKLAGTNRSDDLAMLLKHPVGGLQPDTEYAVELEMTFATTVPADCVGIGGPPGEAVNVKLGAAPMEPVVAEDNNGDFSFNIDKGNQTSSGEDAVRVGDLTNGQTGCPDDVMWRPKTVSTRGQQFTARTDADGRMWVYGLTDSGFEGRSGLPALSAAGPLGSATIRRVHIVFRPAVQAQVQPGDAAARRA